MMRRVQILTLCVVIAAGLVSAGCSGPGVTVATIQAAGLQALAADHVSAVLLLKGWLKIMYWKTNVVGPCEPERRDRDYADGSSHFWGTNSDCSTYDYWQWADGSGEGTLTFPNGDVEETSWTGLAESNGIWSQDVERILRDGTEFVYHWELDNTRPGRPQTRVGWAELAKGPRVDWTWHRVSLGQDHLHLDLPDGSQLDVRIPLTQVAYGPFWPIFNPGGVGYFVGAGGDRLDFTISGQNDCWENWTFTAADGTYGAFNLAEDFAGNGNLSRNGSVVGALRWPEEGFGTLDLVGAGSVEVTPSAAARDFQVDRWVANMAAMGPMPMY